MGRMKDLHATHEPLDAFVSETGGVKQQKLARFDLIPTRPLTLMAEAYGKGLAKYPTDDSGVDNWRKGYPFSQSYASLQRHANAYQGGEDIDPETGIHHLISVAFHAFTLVEHLLNPAMADQYDDRQDPLSDLIYYDDTPAPNAEAWLAEYQAEHEFSMDDALALYEEVARRDVFYIRPDDDAPWVELGYLSSEVELDAEERDHSKCGSYYADDQCDPPGDPVPQAASVHSCDEGCIPWCGEWVAPRWVWVGTENEGPRVETRGW